MKTSLSSLAAAGSSVGRDGQPRERPTEDGSAARHTGAPRSGSLYFALPGDVGGFLVPRSLTDADGPLLVID